MDLFLILAKSSDNPERQAYAFNIQRIGDLARMIDVELERRGKTERYDEITLKPGWWIQRLMSTV